MHAPTVSREELLDSTGNDETFRQFINDFFAFSTRVEVIRAGFGKLIGLTGVEYTILVAVGTLADHGPVHVNSLAEYVHLSGTFVTIQTNKLAKDGMLTKIKDSKDGRKVLVEMTTRAKSLLEGLAEHQRPVNDMLFNSLSRSDFVKLTKLFDSLVADAGRAVSLVNYKTKMQE